MNTRDLPTDRPLDETLLPREQLAPWLDAVEAAFPGLGAAEFVDVALRRTLTRTLRYLPDGTVFVITGDIPAMWLRDSSAQMWPYLRLIADDPHGPLADMILGVLKRQFAYIAHDPYGNAFNSEPNGNSYHQGDLDPDPLLWERKYEVDSLCLPVLLAARFARLTGRAGELTDALAGAVPGIVETIRTEQDHAASAYRFIRPDTVAQDTLTHDGRGAPVARTGMTWSAFRPSDDACTYGYNVPGNLLAAKALDELAELVEALGLPLERAAEARGVADEIRAGVRAAGLVDVPGLGSIYAYETDGLGNHLLMDDANLPSLIGLPLLSDVRVDDELYQRTRAWVLSPANPYYYSGSAAAGIGSPHTAPGHVWPIALAVEGLTSTDERRRHELVALLLATRGGTEYMHEGFHVDDPTWFSRDWFSWADAMACELILDCVAPAAR
ncbi:MAG: glycoside hydrolase family 125 protein [Arachnia sp.]